jgi:hypothetical protein
MRVVAGATLAAGWLTGGLLSAYVSSWEGIAASANAIGGGGFAAGATPDIVLLIAARAAPGSRRGIRPATVLGFRSSDPKTAPMRKL